MTRTSRYRIGFVTIEAITSYPAQLWKGANDCATELGVNLITYSGFPKQEAKLQDDESIPKGITNPFLNLFDPKYLDGVVVWTAGILEDHAEAEKFLEPFRSIPLVSIGVDLPGTSRVLLDNYQGMSDMVTHLITNCGRRNIAFITGTATNRDAQIRLQAYRDTLQRHQLQVCEEYIIPGIFGWKAGTAGKQAAIELLERRSLPIDAIVAASDDLALGVMEYMQQRGIAVPEEIAITGFDNIPEGLSIYPKLTTVAQDAYESAWHAVRLLMAKIQGQALPERLVIPNQVLVRDSCGARQLQKLPNRAILSEKAAQNQKSVQEETIREALATNIAKKQANFRKLFAESFPAEAVANTDKLFAVLQRSILMADADEFIAPIRNLVYATKNRTLLAGFKYQLLSLIRDIALEFATNEQPQAEQADYEVLYVGLKLLLSELEQLLADALMMYERDEYLTNQHHFVQLRILNRNLMISYDPQRLAKIFQRQLPFLNIDLVYIALFTSTEQPTDEVHLVMVYDRQNNLAEAPTGQLVKISELASGISILQDRLLNLILLPLYSNNVYAGFVIFSVGPQLYQLYTQLCDTIGYTVVNGLLLEKIRNHASELEARIAERTAALQQSNAQLQSEIAERIMMEMELAQARDQALEVARLKSEFLATMSHEIRTPMNGIMGMTELLLDSDLSDEQTEYATVAYEESQRLLSIINDILDFSKIEAGKLILENAEFSLVELIQSITKLLVPRAEDKGIALLSHISSDLPQTVEGDSARLRQVVMNLVSNAIKFTHEGEVVIRVARHKKSDIFPEQRNGKPIVGVEIVVRDSGVGMSPQTMQRLFEAFVQADSSTTRRYGGTGLGLAISRRLVELMGGKISVESELDRGSKFTVILPMTIGEHSLLRMQQRQGSKQEIATSPAPSSPVTPATSSATPTGQILLVEDHENNQRVATARLKKLGYDVVLAENGGQAVELVTKGAQSFLLILMDWQMPEMDGLEATRRIREAEKKLGIHIPIIGMTANAMKGDREKCLAAGMDDYLSKPINAQELQQVLQKWVGERTVGI